MYVWKHSILDPSRVALDANKRIFLWWKKQFLESGIELPKAEQKWSFLKNSEKFWLEQDVLGSFVFN